MRPDEPFLRWTAAGRYWDLLNELASAGTYMAQSNSYLSSHKRSRDEEPEAGTSSAPGSKERVIASNRRVSEAVVSQPSAPVSTAGSDQSLANGFTSTPATSFTSTPATSFVPPNFDFSFQAPGFGVLPNPQPPAANVLTPAMFEFNFGDPSMFTGVDGVELFGTGSELWPGSHTTTTATAPTTGTTTANSFDFGGPMADFSALMNSKEPSYSNGSSSSASSSDGMDYSTMLFQSPPNMFGK
jgi:hypothetical protein